jgi:membrane protein DedA with SNARE-associated domain
MTETPPPDVEDGAPRPRRRPAELICGAGLALGLIASYAFIGLSPSMLAHHDILLETLAGTSASIVTGGAYARVGRDSLVLVVIAPIATIALYDVFVWWAGRLWGEVIIDFYAKHNPRARRWIGRAEQVVRRRGIWALALGHYLPIPNVVLFLACGASGMSLAAFVLGDLMGLLLWEALLVSLGWAIGHPAVHVVGEIGHYSLWVTIGVVVAVIAVGSVRQRRASRSEPERIGS